MSYRHFDIEINLFFCNLVMSSTLVTIPQFLALVMVVSNYFLAHQKFTPRSVYDLVAETRLSKKGGKLCVERIGNVVQETHVISLSKLNRLTKCV